MAPPRRALIAITSAHAPLYADGKETGLFITEALHPFNVFKEAGFEVDLVSETGTYQPDWLSQQNEWLPDEDRKVWEDPNSEFRSKLDKLLKPTDVSWKDYGIFFASAGHASLIDYPTATGLQSLASHIYTSGNGVLSAVCHGAAIFPGVLDDATSRTPIIAGKRVTGFTTEGEKELGVLDTIGGSWGRKTVEQAAAEAGATYVGPPRPFEAFAVTDGRVVTGANPASARMTAEEALKAWELVALRDAAV
ncbi:chaperone protein hsp31 [Diplodia corticola]|uniref:D-lactate dehydratase n=1 Tax=Diplodia corticola TaxID=236234 RepID=A0A1J9QPC6_9PEZI|nr:chaperone protein hsp31 [Diplodia corticola]OJD30304.1 chaperone protein hsp31 [Diplodia corticola]